MRVPTWSSGTHGDTWRESACLIFSGLTCLSVIGRTLVDGGDRGAVGAGLQRRSSDSYMVVWHTPNALLECVKAQRIPATPQLPHPHHANWLLAPTPPHPLHCPCRHLPRPTVELTLNTPTLGQPQHPPRSSPTSCPTAVFVLAVGWAFDHAGLVSSLSIGSAFTRSSPLTQAHPRAPPPPHKHTHTHSPPHTCRHSVQSGASKGAVGPLFASCIPLDKLKRG